MEEVLEGNQAGGKKTLVEEEVVEIPGELEEVSLCTPARRRAEMPVLLLVGVVGRRNHPEYV